VSHTRRPQVWGVLNVTPDSFSDGGRYVDYPAARKHAEEMLTQGADVIDIGGESTRPGAERVDAEVEQERVLPLVEALVASGAIVSVDTMRADTALRALEAGAHIINDVSGGLADEAMFAVMAQASCEVVLMHWRGHSAAMDDLAVYTDVVREVSKELSERVDAARAAGISGERLVVDPGLGFAKSSDHSWELLAHIGELGEPGMRILVGASRKRFVGAVLPEGHHVLERDAPSAVVGALLAEKGVWALRVHHVAAQVRALDIWQALQRGGTDG
jgi:dihydropteroate synthase